MLTQPGYDQEFYQNLSNLLVVGWKQNRYWCYGVIKNDRRWKKRKRSCKRIKV
jgi:hypothetical protein